MGKKEQKENERVEAVLHLLRKQSSLTLKQEKFCNNACVERFLRAKGDNVKKAAKHLRTCLSWRESIGTDHLIADEFSAELADGAAYVAGHDDESRPVIIFRIKQDYQKIHSSKLFTRLLVFTLEVAIGTMSKNIEQFVLLFDASFFRSGPAFMNLLLGTLKIFPFLVLFVISLLSAAADESSDDPLIRQVVPGGEDHLLNAEHHFSIFKTKYGKTYATAEEHDRRLGIFKVNLRRAKRHQTLDPSAVHGVTQFSDLTPAEFRRSYLGLKPLRLPADAQKAPILPTNDLPTDFDWREHGAVTPIKNQGSCGSCWSFSTTGALEGAHFLATGELVSLSEQQLVDCDHECDPEEAGACDSGCGGGLMTTAFEYTLKAGGLEREEDYPYTGTDRGTCKFDKSKIVASLANFSVVSIDEDQIAANLVKNGPLSVGINAAFMQTYIGGVSCPYICSKWRLDHAVLLVGFGSAGYAPIRFKEKPYWILKNSWGENWGENGYYKICRGRDICGVDSMVSTAAAIHTTGQ